MFSALDILMDTGHVVTTFFCFLGTEITEMQKSHLIAIATKVYLKLRLSLHAIFRIYFQITFWNLDFFKSR